MKRLSLLYMGALTGILVCLNPPASKADDYDKKTVVTISQRAEAPGIILEPGTYVIKLLNSSSNRHIAEIMNERMDHLYALTFTAAAERVERAEKPILTFYEGTNGRPPALRKWFWPGDTIGQEFIYPKDQAARISAATKERVPEGDLPTVADSGQKLTPDNANGLALQSRDESKPAAAPFVAAAAEPAPAPAPAQVIAQNSPPPQPQSPAVDQAPQPNSVAAQPDTSDRNLPQTASNLPLILLIGILSIAVALVLRTVRRSS